MTSLVLRSLFQQVGNEELENWLLRLIHSKIEFQFFEVVINNLLIGLLRIQRAMRQPIQFKNLEFIRIGS
jgi:hypothetical protein